MHRDLAKSRTRKAQLAAGVLLAGAAVVAAVPGSILGNGGEAEPAAVTTPAAPKAVAALPPATVIDPNELAISLDKIAPPPPAAPPKVEVAEAAAPEEVVPPPAPPAPPWRYIGVILGQTRESHRAFVAVNEKQQLVREGDKIDADIVDEIHDRYLMVTGPDQAQRRVEIAMPERAKISVVSTAGGADAAAIAAAAPPVDTAYRPSDAEVEFLRKELEQGTFATYIDPSATQYQMKSPEEIAMMVAAGDLRPGKFGGRTGVGPRDPARDGVGVNELDALRRLTRLRMQNLDDEFRNGVIDHGEFKRRIEVLEGDMPTEDQIRGVGKGPG